MSCAACFQGSVHDGAPRGKTIKLHGLDTYVVEPTREGQVKGIIVIIPDAFGWEFNNNRLLADHYADKSDYKVYLPDFMNGHAAPEWMLTSLFTALQTHNPLTKIWNFLKTIVAFIPFMFHNNPGKTHPVVKGFFEQLRKEEGSTLPIGAAGFCWGGKHAILLSHGSTIDGKTLVDAVFTGHPSFLDIPGDIEKIALPVSIAVGDKDNQIKAKHFDIINSILAGKPDSAKSVMTVYEDATHGFCVRAAIDMEELAQKAARAEDQCIEWFQAHFKST
ncbi:dienelactone hydrolase [Mariannaea sp. PMI_226]|nr:dienelactone hydrolase [Mariannaea sp. PMI_226]